MTKVAVFTCAIGNFDWIHRPKFMPQGVDFLRFSDRRPLSLRGWSHRRLTNHTHRLSSRMLSRFPKIQPHVLLADYDIGVWVDGNVQVVGDITPLVCAFSESECDIALFPHPSGRSVEEEIDFAIAKGRISPDFYDKAEQQRTRYKSLGLLEKSIHECTIIFFRISSVELRRACDLWWQELCHFTERDQISQPFAMHNTDINILNWDWHFDTSNVYFKRFPHRPRNFWRRMKTGAHFLGNSRIGYWLVRIGIRTAGVCKRYTLGFLNLSNK